MTQIVKTTVPFVASPDAAVWRADFPIFQQKMNGKDLVFLDSAASAQKPQPVIDALTRALTQHYANVHRGIYAFSQTTTTAFEQARAKVADFINTTPESIIFTRGATEAINLVAASWGGAHLKTGDEIVITTLEHHANIVPWQMIAEKTGAVVRVVPMTDAGEITLEALESTLSPRTKMVAFTAMSNALGTILPIAAMVKAAQKIGAVTLVDACQAVVHGPIDVVAWGCDFCVFSGHKLYGPTGVGVLYGRTEIVNAMPPYQGGGDMIDVVTFEKTTFKDAPARFEAGTPAIAEVLALGAAVDYLHGIGMAAIAAHEADLFAYAEQALQAIDGLRLYGRAPKRSGILAFNVEWAHPSDVATILDKEGIAVRVGHHCCMPLMARLGVTGTLRASLGLYNTRADSDALVAGILKAKRMLA